MKKMGFLLIICLLSACAQTDNNIDNLAILNKELKKIENDVLHNNILHKQTNGLQRQSLDREIANADFFNKINEIKYADCQESKIEKAHAIENEYNIATEISNFSPSEEQILKTYFNLIKSVPQEDAILLSAYYMQQIQSLTADAGAKVKCIDIVSFTKDIMISVDFDNLNNKDIISRSKHNDCVGRDCWDCCMYKKSYALFVMSNWIEQTLFIVNAPVNTAWWAVSCGWDCIF